MGIIKTAMMSGAAMYGVKQFAKSVHFTELCCPRILTVVRTAESHRDDSGNSQARAEVDPEYLEWLEWKRQSAKSAPPSLNQSERGQVRGFNEPERRACGYYTGQQQLHLIQASDMPPSYSCARENEAGYFSGAGYQPLEFTPRQESNFNDCNPRLEVNRGRGGPDLGVLIGQGMNMLQARRGSDQIRKGDLIGKFSNK